MKNLSVVLAVYNEEKNLARCLASAKDIADEIIVVDGGSADTTVSIAKQFGAKVIETDNPLVFHKNKQKALDAAAGKWILQLDADEELTPELAREIRGIAELNDDGLKEFEKTHTVNKLFARHQSLLENRDGTFGTGTGKLVAFFVARRNFFLGKAMTYAGMYPDGVIRLVRKGHARFPSVTVHEQMAVDGKVSWLTHDLLHYSNPDMHKYIAGAKKYTNILAEQMADAHVPKNLRSYIYYNTLKPLEVFLSLLILHKGIFDGIHGILFSLFSALHYPVGFMKYVRSKT